MKSVKMYTLICTRCRKSFEAENRRRYFCSQKCALQKLPVRPGSRMPLELASGTKGAILEMLVAAHLMWDGWAVFEAISPNGSTDLIAMKAEQESRYIEVRSGVIASDGSFSFNQGIHEGFPRPTEYGIFIYETNEVHFIKIEPNESKT